MLGGPVYTAVLSDVVVAVGLAYWQVAVGILVQPRCDFIPLGAVFAFERFGRKKNVVRFAEQSRRYGVTDLTPRNVLTRGGLARAMPHFNNVLDGVQSHNQQELACCFDVICQLLLLLCSHPIVALFPYEGFCQAPRTLHDLFLGRLLHVLPCDGGHAYL